MPEIGSYASPADPVVDITGAPLQGQPWGNLCSARGRSSTASDGSVTRCSVSRRP